MSGRLRRRQREADRIGQLLAQVRDQACSARQHRHPLQRIDREADAQQHRRNRGRDVEAQVLADDVGDDRLDRFGDFDEALAAAGLQRHLEQLRDARIARLVQRMAIAGDRLALGAQRRDDALRRLLQVAAVLSRGAIDLFEQPPRGLGGAEDHRTGAEDAGSDGALHRVGRGGQRHPGCLHARH
jgi:hypothetical protein